MAKEVELASYMYDHPKVQDVLLKRLKGRAPFTLNVLVDAEMFASRSTRRQKPRLTALHAAGAHVYLCKGSGTMGAYHLKAMVIDRRLLYTGTANLTEKSMENEELCFKLEGPVVQEVVDRLAAHRRRASVWSAQ